MYVKCVKISYGNAEGNFQNGQAGKDENGNLFRFKGVSKQGVNIWLHVMTLNQITGKYESRFFIPKEALKAVEVNPELRAKLEQKTSGYAADLKRMRAAIKDKKPASSFGRGKFDFGKDVRRKFQITYDRGA
tara:strand:- start:163 stop:558 length:396 start_codon:yes stop_codon:yes gene_type:complete